MQIGMSELSDIRNACKRPPTDLLCPLDRIMIKIMKYPYTLLNKIVKGYIPYQWLLPPGKITKEHKAIK